MRAMIVRRGVIGLAAVAGLCIAVPGSAAAAESGTRLVLRPADGRSMPPAPVVIRVRAGNRAKVTARLNGRSITKHLTRPRKGVRRLRATPSHGLLHRRNVLRVKRRRDGKVRRQVVRFRVRPQAPLAAPGVRRTITQHARFRLDGRSSRHHRARGSRGGAGRLDYSWTVTRAPHGSALAGGSSAGSDTAPQVETLAPDASLNSDDTARPRLRPDVPGTYKVKLEVIASDGTSGVSAVPLKVDPTPLVEVDTMTKPAGQSRWGIRVGDVFYPDPGNSQQWLQLLVLKAESLEPVPGFASKSYDCPAATENPHPDSTAAVASCMRQLTADLNTLKQQAQQSPGKSFVVIAASQRPDGGIGSSPAWSAQPPVGAAEALVPIGMAPPTYLSSFTPMLRGRMSIIGNVGGSPASAVFHQNLDLAELRDDGEIRGLLLRDNKKKYSTFESAEHIPFDTQAPGSTARKSVIRIGDDRVASAEIPAGSNGGFHVVIAERQDLLGPSGALVDSYWFDTGGQQGFRHHPDIGELKRMNQAISEATSRAHGHGVLVFISTLGNPTLKNIADITNEELRGEFNDAAKQFVDLLTEKLGATRSRAYRTLDPGLAFPNVPNLSYSLAASFGTRAARGLEAEAPQTGAGLNGAPLAGTLTREGRDYGFEIETGVVAAEPDNAGTRLSQLALSEPSDWPEKGNGGHTSAIKWITGELGWDTKRSQFWSEDYSDQNWNTWQGRISKLEYAGSSSGFSAADFKWAQDELNREIEWLKSAHAYVATLAKPFGANQQFAWADVASIAANVNNSAKAPAVDKALVEAGLLFDAVRETATVIPGAGEVVGVVNTIYNTTLEWTKVDAEGTEAEEPFEVAAADAGSKLADRLALTQKTIEEQLFFVIASDYRKLRTVGLCGAKDPACPQGPVTEWQLTPDELDALSEAVRDGSTVSVYGALLPAKYRAWAPPPGEHRWINFNPGGYQPAGADLLGWHCPFNGLPDTAQATYPVRRNLGFGGSGDTWQPYAYAQRTGSGVSTVPYAMTLPDSPATNPVFKGPPNGLSVDRETFFWRYFANRTSPFQAQGGTTESEYGFPLKDSRIDWINSSTPGIKYGCG